MARPKMSRVHRAKQFMPFSALPGLQEALRQKEIEHCLMERPELSEEAAEAINSELVCVNVGDSIEVKYFKEGRILTLHGRVEKIDKTYRRMIISEREIRIDDLLEVKR